MNKMFLLVLAFLILLSCFSLVQAEEGAVGINSLEDVFAEDASVMYIIDVVDQNGDPVPGVVVSFCTDTECSFARGDEQGRITFEGKPYPYHVDIIQVPDGYSFEPLKDDFTATDSGGMTLTVIKDEQ